MIFLEKEIKKERKREIKQLIFEISGTLLGAFIMAIGVALFLLPNKLSTGGFSGLATIIYYFLKFPIGVTIIAFNTPLFLFAGYKIGKKFFVKSIIGTLSYSFFLDLLDKYSSLTEDTFLACIYGGIIVGLGTAVILKSNSSTGGSDLISMLFRKYKPDISASTIIIVFDTIIVGLNVLFFRQIEIGLYSAIAIYLMGKVIDIVFEGIYFTKLLIIISDKHEEISEQIGTKVRKGTTGLYGKGMYSNEEKTILLCAAARGDVARVKQIVRNIDPYSFVMVANAREVLGKGFK